MDTLSWVCYPKEIHLIPCVLVICKLQCWHRIDHKFSMHEILDDVTPCFHFHAQPLYHNLDIWPCFGHSKEYDFDNLLPECLFYCKNKKWYSSTIVSVKSKKKKLLYDLVLKLPRESSKERSLWGNSTIFFTPYQTFQMPYPSLLIPIWPFYLPILAHLTFFFHFPHPINGLGWGRQL